MDKAKESLPLYRILLLGDTTVGKTCFSIRFNDNTFREIHLMTIGIDNITKEMTLKNGKKVKVQICDTAGQERFKLITKNFYKKAEGIILLYDITNKSSFDGVKEWVKGIKEGANPNIVICLVGNKIDMKDERVIKTEEGKKMAESFNISFFEASAKNGTNVAESIEFVVEEIDKIFAGIDELPSIKLDLNKKKKNNGCC